MVEEGCVLCFTCGFQNSLAYLLEFFRYLFQSEKHDFKRVYKFGGRESNWRDLHLRPWKNIPLVSLPLGHSTPIYPRFFLCPLLFISLLNSTSPTCIPPGAPDPVLKAQWGEGGVEWGQGMEERHVSVENSNKILHGTYNLH